MTEADEFDDYYWEECFKALKTEATYADVRSLLEQRYPLRVVEHNLLVWNWHHGAANLFHKPKHSFAAFWELDR